MINNTKLSILFALFIGLLVWMNLLWWKIVSLFWISVSVGIFMAPLTFLITDIVEEVHWKNIVKNFVIWWILTLVIIFVYTAIFVALEPHSRFEFNNEYWIIFWNSMRMVLASIVAFWLAQVNDMLTFEALREKTKWKALWLRNNISTMLSQAIDTFVFMMIAFYWLTPKFTLWFIISLALPYYAFKILFAFLDTPLVYLWVNWLRKWEKK
jgi:uncharacterized integral membrane protein (TIGR00697 family)